MNRNYKKRPTKIPAAKEDNQRILSKYNISQEFPAQVLDEIQKISEAHLPNEKERKNLLSKPFVTIDGETAKDFDDAVYVEKLNQGFRLFVSIADVSYYVPEDSALDKEAFERANSTYFSDFVNPMLPEKLSNNLCSLRPDEQRLTLTAEMDFDSQGHRLGYKIYPSLIKSVRRMTYQEVENIFKKGLTKQDEPVKFLLDARKLGEILQDRHLKNQALDLNIPSSFLNLDSAGEPVNIHRENRLFSHKLIEQFMLAANQVASHFLEKNDKNVIYRIHESPASEKLTLLESFAKQLGFSKSLKKREHLIKFLKQFKNHPKEASISKLVLRALAQARYSSYNKSHYGLNFKSYTHFTSPIRRYCDLVVHRMIKQALFSKNKQAPSQKDLENIAISISEKEQNSVKAEREVLDIKKARLLLTHLGEQVEGIVSSVVSFGLFINLTDFDIEGLVRLKDLPGYWLVDDVNMQIKNKRTSYRIKFGDSVCVQIVSSNILAGEVNFKLVSHKGQPLKAKPGKRRPFYKRN